MEKAKAVAFINWTDEVFTYPWGGVEYTFKPGQPMYLEEGLAVHFAKHLANREINKLGKLMNDPMVKTFIKRCYGEEFLEAADEKSLEIVLANTEKGKNVVEPKPFCKFCDARGPIKHKANCPTLKPKPIVEDNAPDGDEEDDEEEFGGIK